MSVTPVDTTRPTLAVPLLAADRTAVEAALAAARSPATRRAYESQMGAWTRWAGERGYPLGPPAEPEHLAGWLVWLAQQGRSASSIGQAAAAISAAHADAGIPDPTQHQGVRLTLAGIRRQVGTAPRRLAHPLTTDEIRRIVDGINRDSLRGKRDSALVLIGYAGALRRSELAGLRTSDLSIRPAGIVVTIRRSKTDQVSAGQVVGIARGRSPVTDPVAAVRDWIGAAGLDGDRWLYPTIAWSDARPLCRPIRGEDVCRILVRRAAAVGLGDLPISGHSLRAGHATTAARAGVPADRLARTTRHRSLSSLARYVRPAEALADTSSADLGL
jgi:integrase